MPLTRVFVVALGLTWVKQGQSMISSRGTDSGNFFYGHLSFDEEHLRKLERMLHEESECGRVVTSNNNIHNDICSVVLAPEPGGKSKNVAPNRCKQLQILASDKDNLIVKPTGPVGSGVLEKVMGRARRVRDTLILSHLANPKIGVKTVEQAALSSAGKDRLQHCDPDKEDICLVSASNTEYPEVLCVRAPEEREPLPGGGAKFRMSVRILHDLSSSPSLVAYDLIGNVPELSPRFWGQHSVVSEFLPKGGSQVVHTVQSESRSLEDINSLRTGIEERKAWNRNEVTKNDGKIVITQENFDDPTDDSEDPTSQSDAVGEEHLTKLKKMLHEEWDNKVNSDKWPEVPVTSNNNIKVYCVVSDILPNEGFNRCKVVHTIPPVQSRSRSLEEIYSLFKGIEERKAWDPESNEKRNLEGPSSTSVSGGSTWVDETFTRAQLITSRQIVGVNLKEKFTDTDGTDCIRSVGFAHPNYTRATVRNPKEVTKVEDAEFFTEVAKLNDGTIVITEVTDMDLRLPWGATGFANRAMPSVMLKAHESFDTHLGELPSTVDTVGA